MKTIFSLLAYSLLLLFLTALTIIGQDKNWRPVTPLELESKTPVVEPGAAAEAIFWEVRVDDSSVDELSLKHYVRVKIFTEKGREDFSKHDIPFTKGTKVKDVEARVTKPDGSSVFLKKEDVLEREIVKASGVKVKAKSFALPGLEVGSIVEYRYKEVIEDTEANMRLILQREVPMQSVSYYVRPFAGDRAMAYFRFNVGDTKFEKDKDGFYRTSLTNVPSFKEEPSMLPEDQVKKWMYLYYVREMPKNPDEYWGRISKAFYDSSKSSMKTSDEVKTATTQAITGAATDEEKLRKIFDFTKTQIRNLSYSENVSDEEWKKVRNAKNAGDTLKLKMGSAGDIDVVFGAMARAAGFDARLALSGDRSEMFFDRNIPNFSLMLGSTSVAVKVGGDWRFFSPASYFVPFGMLSWAEENQVALITDPKEVIWKETPLSPAELSQEKRSGKFKLLEDGTLVGEARIEFTGHRAASQKNLNRGDSTVKQEETLKNLIRTNIFGSAEIDNFTIENVSDPAQPFVYTFKIRVPGYASRTGKRLFFQPNVFERNSKPRFTASDRKYDVYISYPYSEQDDITIEFPEGFALESGDSPGKVRDQQGIGSHETTMHLSQNGKILSYKRSFSFGNGGFIHFPVASYPLIKQMFEMFNKADVHQLTLRQGATASVTK